MTKRMKRMKRTKRMKRKGGTVLPENTQLINPRWRFGQVYWNTVVEVTGLQLYGSSIPFFDDLTCFQTFAFYMYRLEIRKIISIFIDYFIFILSKYSIDILKFFILLGSSIKFFYTDHL